MSVAPAIEHYWLTDTAGAFWSRMADPDTALAHVTVGLSGRWQVFNDEGEMISAGHERLTDALDIAEAEGDFLAGRPSLIERLQTMVQEGQ